MVPLLPKLRGQFAEFLNNASLAHLRILSSSTCVGLRYGHLYTISTSFSRQLLLGNSLLIVSLYLSIRVFPLPRFPFTPVSLASFKYIGGAGISTCCPSDTPFGLSLGPDLPWADEPSPGNLRLSMAWILTMLSLLIPAFSLLLRPVVLSIYLLPTTECSSTAYNLRYKPAISVYSLAPVIFRATPLDQ